MRQIQKNNSGDVTLLIEYLNCPQCDVTTRITITDTRIEYKNNKNNNKIINIKNKEVYLA